jgi:hypothetical protein
MKITLEAAKCLHCEALFTRHASSFQRPFEQLQEQIAVGSSPPACCADCTQNMVLEVAEEIIPPTHLSKVQLPDWTTKLLGTSARDVFSVFEILCRGCV